MSIRDSKNPCALAQGVVKHNKDGLNVNVQRTDMAQFTGMARVQEFVRTVQALLSMIISILMVAGIVGGIGFAAWSGYEASKTTQTRGK